jgi:diguanylate cyclase (GGDEF)-like protein/PAS domain S-box-containing protein
MGYQGQLVARWARDALGRVDRLIMGQEQSDLLRATVDLSSAGSLRTDQAIVRSIFDDIPDAVVIADRARRIVLINPALIRMFGYQLDDIRGERTAVLYETAAEFERQGRERFNLTAEEQLASYVVDYRRRDGEIFPGETVGAPIRDGEGETLGFLGIIRDISYRRRVEQTLHRLYGISSTRTLSWDQKIEAMLETGTRHFGLPLGIVAEIVGQDYRVAHVVCPDHEIEPGTHFALGNTFCTDTLQANGPLGFHRAGASVPDHPCYHAFGLEAYLGAPLLVDGERFGTINFSSAAARAPFSSSDYEIVLMFSEWIGHEIARQRDFEALRRAHEELHRLATTDPLTEVCNRRHFLELGAQEVDRAKRAGHALSLLYFDLDHFKRINDQHGHHVGDVVLEAVARTCSTELRAVDVIGRLGGEEFAVVLPDTAEAGAHLVAERIRHQLAKQTVAVDDLRLSVTASIGTATLTDDHPDLEALLMVADRAAYRAKALGRDCVVAA